MKFVEVKNGQYRARLDGDVFVWIVREGDHHWWWSLGSITSAYEWGMESNGPFDTMWDATADAVARYGDYSTRKIIWFVHRPTYMGRVERPALWQMEAVVENSARDKMLTSGRTVNDAGELVELPGEWWRFTTRASAEAWMEDQRRLWEEWNS